jgi:hypothetical protein
VTSRTSAAPDAPVGTPEDRPAVVAPPSGRRRLTLLGILLGLVAILTAVLLPVAPVRMSTPEVTWPQQPGSPVSTMLELTSQRPLTLDIRFGCATVRAAAVTPTGVLLATIRPEAASAGTEGLLVTARAGVLQVISAGSTMLREQVRPGACDYVLHGDGNGLRISRDGAMVGRAASSALPQVDVLATSLGTLAPGAGEDLAVRLQVDDQFATSPTPAKVALTVLAVLAAAGAIVWLRRTAPGTARARRRTRRGPPFWLRRAVDAVVVGVLLLWTLIAPMTGDDGYYAAMARNAPFEGYVGNYYQLLNQSFTPFTWFYRLLGWWEQVAGSSPVVLKVPALVAGLLTYAMAARLVALVPWARARTRTAAHIALALAFAVWWLPNDMGVRPESTVALAGTATLLAVVTAILRESLAWWAGAVLVAGVGFVCHPTGFVVLAPLIAGLPSLTRLVRSGRAWTTIARLLCVVAPGALASVVAFGDGTLRDFLRGQEIFLAAQPQLGWTDEYQRYAMLLGPGFMGSYAKRLAVLITLAVLLGWFVLAAVLRGRGRPLPWLTHLSAVSTVMSFLLLWPTPSKWSFHFGSVAGVGAVFLALALVNVPRALRELRAERALGWPAAAAVAVGTVLAVALSFSGDNAWPVSWLLGVPYANVPPHLFGVRFGSVALWGVLVCVLGGALWWWRRRRSRGADGPGSLAAASAVLLVGALVLSSAYLLGSFTIGTVRTLGTWSPWADGVRDPLARNCDAAGAFRVLDDTGAQLLQQLPGGPAAPAAAGPIFREGSGWYTAVPPATTAGPVWGSLQPPAGENAVGTTTSAWYRLPQVDEAQQRVALTAAGRLTDGNHLVAEYGRASDGSTTVVARQTLDDGLDLPYWRTLLLDSAVARKAGADTVRLVATDGTTGAGGWLAFSQPAVHRIVPVQQYLGGAGTVAVAWQITYLFPCQQLPTIRSGITQPSQFGVLYGSSVSDQLGDATMLVIRGGIFAPLFREASVTMLPTSLPGAPNVHDVLVYRFENPYRSGRYTLTPHTTTVSGWAAPPGWGDRPAR